MHLEIGGARECLDTVTALVRLLPIVASHMNAQIIVAGETVATNATEEVTLARVSLLVAAQLLALLEGLVAALAGVEELCVQERVLAQVSLAGETLGAVFAGVFAHLDLQLAAGVQALAIVFAQLMAFQGIGTGECCLAKNTLVLLVAMKTLDVRLQVIAACKLLGTMRTAVWLLLQMRQLVPQKMTMAGKGALTNFTAVLRIGLPISWLLATTTTPLLFATLAWFLQILAYDLHLSTKWQFQQIVRCL